MKTSINKAYIGFSITDSMFSSVDGGEIYRETLPVGEVKKLLKKKDVISFCEVEDESAINYLKSLYKIVVSIPATTPRVVLGKHDIVIVIRAFYPSRRSSCDFKFAVYTIY
jgi:hypothetical protein